MRLRLVRALDNLNVSRWTGRIPHPYGRSDAEAFFAHYRGRPQDALILFIVRDGELIGGIGIEIGELGYWLAEPHWGQGYGREAARAVVDHAFMTLDRDTVTASYFTGNAASRRILEGLGFIETGTGNVLLAGTARRGDDDQPRTDPRPLAGQEGAAAMSHRPFSDLRTPWRRRSAPGCGGRGRRCAWRRPAAGCRWTCRWPWTGASGPTAHWCGDREELRSCR